MLRQTDDLRITQVRPLIPPAILLEEIPLGERASNVVSNTRLAVANAIKGRDPRLVIIAGPCSIHDTVAALDYATRLAPLAERYGETSPKRLRREGGRVAHSQPLVRPACRGQEGST